MAKVVVEKNDQKPLTSEVVEPLPKSTELAAESEELSTSDESGQSDQQAQAPKPTEEQQPPRKRPMSLAERGAIPNSLYVTLLCVGMLEGCSGMYKVDTLKSWWASITKSFYSIHSLLEYEKELMESVYNGEYRDPMEYLKAFVVTSVAGSILWVLIGKPLSAGLWTGERASRHKMHRYLGLFFLIQYALAWVEFITDYEGAGQFSVIPHTVALNGKILPFLAAVLLVRNPRSLILAMAIRRHPGLLCILFVQGAPPTEGSWLLL